MTFWSRHAFVLLSPDTLRRGLQTAVVERLAREGFTPVAGRVVQADPEMIDDLYADVIAGQWQTWRYRLVDDLFSSGPCLALLCRFDREGGHAALARRKGHQHPHLAEPGTIRSDFRAVNSVLGLIHTSDGPEESRREAAIFGLSEEDTTGGAALALMCALSGSALPERRGFDDVLAGVRGRVLLAALHDLPAGLVDRLRAAFPAPPALGTDGAGERLAALLGGVVPRPLLDLLRCEFTPEWRDAMRMRAAVRTMDPLGVRLDSWERLVLETSLYFPPARGRAAEVAA